MFAGLNSVASAGVEKMCDEVTCNPPSVVVNGADTTQPASLASSKLKSSARPGAWATTSASTVVTTVRMPEPLSLTSSVTNVLTRHELSTTTTSNKPQIERRLGDDLRARTRAITRKLWCYRRRRQPAQSLSEVQNLRLRGISCAIHQHCLGRLLYRPRRFLRR